MRGREHSIGGGDEEQSKTNNSRSTDTEPPRCLPIPIVVLLAHVIIQCSGPYRDSDSETIIVRPLISLNLVGQCSAPARLHAFIS